MLRNFIFLLTFICLSLNCFSQEWNHKVHKEHKSISKIEENNVYVKDDAVRVDKDGIFLRLQGELLPISKLEKDNDGVYFDLDESAAWQIPPRCP